jgi:hypothetical protein
VYCRNQHRFDKVASFVSFLMAAGCAGSLYTLITLRKGCRRIGTSWGEAFAAAGIALGREPEPIV